MEPPALPETTEPTVLVHQTGRAGRITLSRPRALNALTLEMVQSVLTALETFRDDPVVHAVVIDAVGGRAFCAGGDVRALRDLALAGDHAAIERFFSCEYRMNLALGRYPKPVVSLIDGICMGGGVGLSVHGAIRVTTEAAVFAMPETLIGFFPDVGVTHVLPRLRGLFGMYLGLTGARLTGAEATWVGLATHYVPQARLDGLIDAIAAEGVAVIAERAEAPAPGSLAGLDLSAFGADNVDGILRALSAQGGAWAEATVQTLLGVSPSALLWSFEAIRRGAEQNLEQCLAMELALTRHATRHADFVEGVRAAAVDKDRKPRWSPGRLDDVDAAAIRALF